MQEDRRITAFQERTVVLRQSYQRQDQHEPKETAVARKIRGHGDSRRDDAALALLEGTFYSIGMFSPIPVIALSGTISHMAAAARYATSRAWDLNRYPTLAIVSFVATLSSLRLGWR
jgi:hypothetical protein